MACLGNGRMSTADRLAWPNRGGGVSPEIDYYNSKPPLNVWLIALAFKLFGANLVSLRLVSVVSAWLTVAVLQCAAVACLRRTP